jgi:hypothetical protein
MAIRTEKTAFATRRPKKERPGKTGAFLMLGAPNVRAREIQTEV